MIYLLILSHLACLFVGGWIYAQYYADVKHGLEADLENVKQLWEKDRQALAEFKAKL